MTTDITSHSYDWSTGTDLETGNTVIYCWSLDRNSSPHLLRFHDFDIFCYVELPLFLNNAYVNWNGYRHKLVYDTICYRLEDNRPYRFMFTYREKIYFYKGENKKYPMLLLCFKSIESMMTCKNKLKFPIKVKGLKGGNEETMVAVRVWETHIPLERKLLTLRNCKYSQWFNIKGVKVSDEDKISTLDNEYVVDWKTLDPIPEEQTVSWITHPKILSFDLETYSDRHNSMPDSLSSKHVIYMVSVVFQKFLEPETRKKEIILFGDCSETDLATVIKTKTETELIDKFQEMILKYDPEIVTGYNIFGYDNDYLNIRLTRKLKEWKPLGRLKNHPSVMKTISWSSSAYKNQDFNILEMSGRISVDLLPVIRRDFKLPIYKLDYVANHFLKKGKHDVTAKQMFEIYELQENLKLDSCPSDIPKCFLEYCKKAKFDDPRKIWQESYKQFSLDEMKKVVDYCVVDSDLVVDLFEKINLWIGLIQMSNIVSVPPCHVYTRGTGIRMISQVYDEASKCGIVMDEMELTDGKITGGFVFDPIPGIYRNILCLDFKSLYPNIQISHNMDHTTMLSPENMDLVPDEKCHVIEWDEEDEDSDTDDEEEKNLVKKKKKVHRKYKFVKEPLGIMPRLLKRLIQARNEVRSRQKGLDKNSLEWNVLEQTQLGIKISANSFFGACSSGFSKLSLKILGECITAKARESTKKMNLHLESNGHRVIYGDSVTGKTPLLIKVNNRLSLITIEELFDTSGNSIQGNEGKEYRDPNGIQIWTEKGWTIIRNVMRHKTTKKIFRVLTNTGYVEVTEDHSLLTENGIEVTPKDLTVGDKLLQSYPVENFLSSDRETDENIAYAMGLFVADGSCGIYKNGDRGNKYSWAINNLDYGLLEYVKRNCEDEFRKRYGCGLTILDTVESSHVYKLVPTIKLIDITKQWRKMCYSDDKSKIVPDCILFADLHIKQAFFRGFYAGDGDKTASNGVTIRFDTKNQLSAASYYYLLKSMGFNISINTRKDKQNIYRLTATKKTQKRGTNKIKKLEVLQKEEEEIYVYDLTTENHHFQAGIGDIIVHNTDSTMPDVGITDSTKAKEIGTKIAHELSELYPKPMEIEHEVTYHTMLCIRKKMYICILLDDHGNAIDDPDKMKVRGVTLARRDNCTFQRNFYKDVVWKVLHQEKFLNVFNFIIDECIRLMSRGVSVEDMIMIKGLGSHYKSKNYMMSIFSREMEKSGNPIIAGDRIQYLLVDTENKDEKVGYKMRTLEIFQERAKSDNPEHIDYIYYLEKTIRNHIEKQLFQVGYKKELEELKNKHSEIDIERFFRDLEYKIANIDKNKSLKDIRLQGYRNKIDNLLKNNEKIKVIDILLEDETISKIAKPLYNFHIKGRLGRGKRPSTRIDKEPILMMVKLFKMKKEVMKEIRENNRELKKVRESREEKKTIKLKILK